MRKGDRLRIRGALSAGLGVPMYALRSVCTHQITGKSRSGSVRMAHRRVMYRVTAVGFGRSLEGGAVWRFC
jgi:hypothetical protein